MILIEKIIFFLSSVFLCFLFARILYNSISFRWVIIILSSVLLTFHTIITFNEPSENWNTPEQRSVTDITSAPSNKDSFAYKYIWDNFILIDNSFDKKLIPNEEFTLRDSLTITITDRNKLYNFFRILNERSDLLDLVICDIGFDNKTNEDSLLYREMNKPEMINKLLLSNNSYAEKKDSSIFSNFSSGNIVEKTSNLLFTSHYLKNGADFSLPYEVYKRINKIKSVTSCFNNHFLIETSNNGKQSLVVNPFFPQFSILDESLLLDGPLASSETGDSLIEDEQSTLFSFNMGSVVTDYGKDMFKSNLVKRKAEGKKNIVFIGSFRSFEEDIHQTIYKKLHGPVILLNIISQLNHKKHFLSLTNIFLIFLFYIIIVGLLIHKSLELRFGQVRVLNKVLKRIGSNRLQYMGKSNVLKTLSTLFRLIFESLLSVFEFLFIEEPHFTLLFLMAWIIYVLGGSIINITFLISYFGIVYLSLKYAYKRTIQPFF